MVGDLEGYGTVWFYLEGTTTTTTATTATTATTTTTQTTQRTLEEAGIKGIKLTYALSTPGHMDMDDTQV